MKPHLFGTVLLAGFCAGALAVPAGSAQTRQSQSREQMRFRAMDTNGDGRISRDEWRGSDRSFRVHDWNGDGILSGNEVNPGAARDVEDEDFDQARRPEFSNWTDRGFANLDHNQDGRITRSEWHYAPEGFIRADRNRDNVLTRAEFLGFDVDSDREDRFEYLDANNNGRVERGEWHGSSDAFEWLDRNNDGTLSRTEVVGDEDEAADLFASLDVNNDDVITQNEWHWSTRSFNRQDTNADGRLTRRELTNAELSAANAGTIGTAGRLVTVDSTERWIDTGVDVRAGDTIVISSSGTIRLSTDASDTAQPGGASRRAANAPLPDQPAGALIARIGDSAPFFVGDRSIATANATGRLYLGVNDDHLADNRGQFRVTVQKR